MSEVKKRTDITAAWTVISSASREKVVKSKSILLTEHAKAVDKASENNAVLCITKRVLVNKIQDRTAQRFNTS
jgi:hypothetical protein